MGTDWKRFLRSVACCFVPVMGLAVGIQEYAAAQGVGGSLGSLFPIPIVGSFEPVTTLEKFCGPILPKCGIANTFRSEVGVGYKWVSTGPAILTGNGVQYDLRSRSFLDQQPPYTEFLADLRLWRLGFRAAYSYFDNWSVAPILGRLQWNGARVGLDFDAVHHEWLTFGASIDYYFIDPRLNGGFFAGWNGATWTDLNRIDIAGQKPLTWGLYFRYMPPVILGIPVHFDAYYNSPITGAKYTYYGALLSFRPQIYRFDLACKLGIEWSQVKFSQFAATTGPGVVLPPTNWQLDMKWQLFRVEVAAYF
jgi:hypothetical protein